MGKLTDPKVRALKFSGRRCKVFDGRGLYIEVSTASKAFKYEYCFHGKRTRITLGHYPDLSLAKARERHQEARRLLAEGDDPHEVERQAHAVKAVERSLQQVAEEYFKTKTTWKESHRSKVLLRMENDVYRRLGNRAICGVTADEILTVLQRVEDRGAVDSAHRIKQTLCQVFRYAARRGFIEIDPMPSLQGALRAVEKSNYAFIKDEARLGEVLTAIDSYTGNPVIRCGLQLVSRVFVRPGELRGARWEEFDIDKRQWVIPAARMKRPKNGDHKVPLSIQALRILEELRPWTGHHEWVFTTGKRSNGSPVPISNNTLNVALRKCEVKSGEHSVHSFRHTASTLLNELKYHEDIIEAQLHHKAQGVRGVYNKAEWVQDRTTMMQDYSDYLDRLKSGACEKGG